VLDRGRKFHTSFDIAINEGGGAFIPLCQGKIAISKEKTRLNLF
jgi:hypothetical protein